MKARSSTRWHSLQITIALVVWYGLSTANGDSNGIFIRHQSGKECPVDTRVNETGILTVTNSTQQCQWRMKKLIDLKRNAIIFNTKNMDCNGGSLDFVIDHKERNLSKNFCNQPKCLVFARLRGVCNNNGLLNNTVQNLFGECDDFEWYIKPHPLLITASSDARNFELNYTMFDCPEEIVTTVATKVMETPHIRMENTSTYASNMEVQTTTIDYGPLYPTASPGAVAESTTRESTTKLETTETTIETVYPTTSAVAVAESTTRESTTKLETTETTIETVYPTTSAVAVAESTTRESTTKLEATETTTIETVYTTPSPPSRESNINETTTKIARAMTTIEVEATSPAKVDFTTQSQTKMTDGTKVLGTEVSEDPGKDRADKLAIIFNSDCEDYEEVRIGNSATLTVTNVTSCFLKMRKLDHLKRQAVIYNTKGMSCEGGPVTFPIYHEGKRRRKNFCNHEKCLVYVKENGRCINEERLNETVQNLFEDCKEFERYIKPRPFEIRKPAETTNFNLNYSLFDCEDEVTIAATSPQEPETTESPITREPKETKGVIAVANTGSGRKMEAWWIIVPLVLIALIAIALSVGYLLCCKSSKRKSRRINGKDEHISTIAL